MTKLSLLFLLGVFLAPRFTSAHALWIETNPVGKKNLSHRVSVFYGEYAEQEIDPVDKWYSDVRDFELWLTGPDQHRVKLEVKRENDRFTAYFTPEQEGVYWLTVLHGAKDLGGKTKYEFSSAASVSVGAAVAQTVPPLPFAVSLLSGVSKRNGEVVASVLLDGKPLADASVEVMGPEGWSKAFKTDAEGRVRFPAIWKGNYVLEATRMSPQTGEWQGNTHTQVWQGTTTFLLVR